MRSSAQISGHPIHPNAGGISHRLSLRQRSTGHLGLATAVPGLIDYIFAALMLRLG
jgi:hypothetical protein